jgi:hypothetical protein
VSETTQADADYRREVRRRLKRTAWIVVLSLPLLNYLVSAGYIMRLRPVCIDYDKWWVGGDIHGRMTDEFAREYARSTDHLLMFSFLTWQREPYIRIGDWWDDDDDRLNATYKAINRIVARRHGIEASDIWRRNVRLAGFEQFYHSGPTCEGVREIAIVGGRWSVSGPPRIDP